MLPGLQARPPRWAQQSGREVAFWDTSPDDTGRRHLLYSFDGGRRWCVAIGMDVAVEWSEPAFVGPTHPARYDAVGEPTYTMSWEAPVEQLRFRAVLVPGEMPPRIRDRGDWGTLVAHTVGHVEVSGPAHLVFDFESQVARGRFPTRGEYLDELPRRNVVRNPAMRAFERAYLADQPPSAWDKACRLARQTLQSFLTREQWTTYAGEKWFEFDVPSGNRYRITAGSAWNVYLVDDQGELIAGYCAHPTGQLPEADVHLAQMLALKADEQGFLAKANVQFDRRRRPPRIDGTARVYLHSFRFEANPIDPATLDLYYNGAARA